VLTWGIVMKLITCAAPAASALAIVCVGSFPALAATPVSGRLNPGGQAYIAGVEATDSQYKSWSGTPSSLAAGFSATETSNSGDSVTVSGSAVADWFSADSGTVNFYDYGWNISVFNPVFWAAYLAVDDDWSYTFTATEDGAIEVQYDLSVVSGNPFGLQGWELNWTGFGVGYPQGSPSGTFIGYIVAGRTYTIQLVASSNIDCDCAIGNYSGYLNGTFSWGVVSFPHPPTGVPEPSTWAMILIGFAGLGYASFRSSSPLAAAR
jgi:hypothetical protein